MTETGTVAVWDVSDPRWPNRHEAKSRWLRKQELPADQMYRVEFFDDGMPRARIFCYALNKDGQRYLNGHDPHRAHDHGKCAVATEPPRVVPLTRLPPRELL